MGRDLYQYTSDAIFCVPDATAIAGSTMTTVATNKKVIQFTTPTSDSDLKFIQTAKAVFDDINGEARQVVGVDLGNLLIYLDRQFTLDQAGSQLNVVIGAAREISIGNVSTSNNITLNGEILKAGTSMDVTQPTLSAIGVNATGVDSEVEYFWK